MDDSNVEVNGRKNTVSLKVEKVLVQYKMHRGTQDVRTQGHGRNAPVWIRNPEAENVGVLHMFSAHWAIG